MRLQVTVRHGHVNDGVRSYVESKFAKLGKRLHETTLVEVVLIESGTRESSTTTWSRRSSTSRGRTSSAGRPRPPTRRPRTSSSTSWSARSCASATRRCRSPGDGPIPPAEPTPVEQIEETLRTGADG